MAEEAAVSIMIINYQLSFDVAQNEKSSGKEIIKGTLMHI